MLPRALSLQTERGPGEILIDRAPAVERVGAGCHAVDVLVCALDKPCLRVHPVGLIEAV
jgi:hypothetical protein